MKVFWTGRNILYIIVWYLEEEEEQQQYIFTFKKFTKLVPKKYPLLQLDGNKQNYTQKYTKKWTKWQTNQKRETSDNLLNKF